MTNMCKYCGKELKQDDDGWYCDNSDCEFKLVDQKVETEIQETLRRERI